MRSWKKFAVGTAQALSATIGVVQAQRIMTPRSFAYGLLLLGLPLAALAGQPASPALVFFSTEARLEVDAGGRVVTVDPDSALPPAIGQAIAAEVGKWRFSAPTKDGRAVAGVTYAQLDACAAPDNGQYRFALRYRGTGPGRAGQRFPVYPSEPMRLGESAKMQVVFRVLPDGKVAIDSADVVEGSKRFQKQFRQSVEQWLGAGQFRPEELDGQPVSTRVTLPIEFTTGEHDREPAAKPPSCEAAIASRDQADRRVALDSPFQRLPTN